MTLGALQVQKTKMQSVLARLRHLPPTKKDRATEGSKWGKWKKVGGVPGVR